MPTVAISPFFNSHHHDNNGNPASGWLVYTYYSRTTQKKDTYKDLQGISKHENPITLDARGGYPGGGLFLIAGETYSIVLKDPNSGTEKTWHSVIGGSGGVVPIATSHTDLSNRDIADQHPTSAITNLDESLFDKVSKSTTSDQTVKSSLIIDGNPSDRALIKMFGNFSTGASRLDIQGDSGYVQIVGSATGDPWVKTVNQTTESRSYIYPEEISVSNSNGTKASRIDINGLTLGGQSKIVFDTTPDVATINEGVVQWDSLNNTLAIGMGGGVVQSVGVESPHRAKNVDGTSFVDGHIGYIYGSSGQRISIKKAVASDTELALKKLLMATQPVADENTGLFNAEGITSDIPNTVYGFAEGDEAWLDLTAGTLSKTRPAKPNYQAIMGTVTVATPTLCKIFFSPRVIPKLGDLSDCDTSSAVQGDFLTKGLDGVYKPNVFYDDWRWAGTGVNPQGASNPAVLTEVNTNEWHWLWSNNTVMAFPDQQIPHDYKEGTDIIPHIHFASRTTGAYTGTWTAVFTLWSGGATGSTKTVYTRTASFNKTMTAHVEETVDFNSVISGLGRSISSCGTVTLKLSLTAGTSVYLLGFDGHYQKDRFGSNSVTSK